MGNYLSPGINTVETDFSFYVKSISTSSCGMVGVAEKGPINEPTLVTSWEQFTHKFGSYIAGYYLAYAARAFFDNGGSVLYVTRVCHYTDITDKSTRTAQCASVTLLDREATTPVATLKVTAIDEGSWGDELSVKVEDGSRDPDGSFNLLVYCKGILVEVFKDVSLAVSSIDYVETRINEVSEYITVDDQGSETAAPDNRPVVGTFEFSGGNDGLTDIADSDYIGDSSQHLGLYAFDEIDALNVLCCPGITTPAVIGAGVAYAEARRDLLFIAETPHGLDPLDAVDFRKGQGEYSHSAFNSSYAALYYPWLNIKDPVSGKTKAVPPTGAIAGCIARSDRKTYVWYAPAGIDRGRIFNVLSLAYRASRGERDVLYPEGVNVIASFPDSGINIWGQKTLQSQPSAVDRINVRRLMMYIEEAISESARFVVFEPNNAQTWRALVRLINPFLSDIRDKGGLYDFSVQCDEETNTPVVIDRNELVARIFVKPTKTAEFVELNFVLTATGTDFKEIFRTS